MFMRARRLADVHQIPRGRRGPAWSSVRALLALGALHGVAMGQTSPPTNSATPGSAPSAPPGGYPPFNAAPAGQPGVPPATPQPPGYAPSPAPQPEQARGSQPPTYAQSPPQQPGSAAQPNYPAQPYPPQGYPPQPGYPPNYQQQGQPTAPQQPSYGQQPGFSAYNEPPLPPPPKRVELQWSLRFRLLDLLFGRVTGEVEYAFAGPFSLGLVPEYVFSNPSIDRASGVKASGAGIAAELGYWVEGRPLRGYFLKAHAGYRSIKFSSSIQDVNVPATQVGAMFGSQSIYGGWFTLSGALGVLYDFQSKDRPIVTGYDSSGREVGYIIGASGLFGNGFDLLGQLSIGASF